MTFYCTVALLVHLFLLYFLGGKGEIKSNNFVFSPSSSSVYAVSASVTSCTPLHEYECSFGRLKTHCVFFFTIFGPYPHFFWKKVNLTKNIHFNPATGKRIFDSLLSDDLERRYVHCAIIYLYYVCMYASWIYFSYLFILFVIALSNAKVGYMICCHKNVYIKWRLRWCITSMGKTRREMNNEFLNRMNSWHYTMYNSMCNYFIFKLCKRLLHIYYSFLRSTRTCI